MKNMNKFNVNTTERGGYFTPAAAAKFVWIPINIIIKRNESRSIQFYRIYVSTEFIFTSSGEKKKKHLQTI